MNLEVGFLELENGKCPFLDWEAKLDSLTRAAIRVRLNRIRSGNLGDCKAVQGLRGIHELRIHIGPGYRIYFGKAKERLIILLCGGDKRSQKRDLDRCREYWNLYKAEGRYGES